MKRRDFIGMVAGTGAALAAMPAAFAQEPKLRGRVTAQGKAMAAVVVSNGAEVTLTGKDGAFELPHRGAERFVFVSSPSGFTCDKWYLPIEGTNGSFDFELRPWAASAKGKILRSCILAIRK